MTDRFDGFSPAALDWLVVIGLDNSREWFLAHKAGYEAEAKGPFLALLGELSAEFGGTPKVFRPNRDVRFSADKRPYKTNVSGYLEGRTTYYLDLSIDGLMAATGYYQMAKDQLDRYRAALATDDEAPEHVGRLRTILAELQAEGLPAEGEALKTAPKGFARDHPEIDLLRRKSLTISAVLPFDEAAEPGRVRDHVARVWRAGEPLNGWLDEHVGPSTIEW